MPAHLGLYVPVYVNLRNHPKFKRLCARLFPNPSPQDRAYVLGMLVNLWTWVLEYYPTGELDGVTAFEIEDAAGWYGEAGVFAEALQDEKIAFLRRADDGMIIVQSWQDYGGKLIRDKQDHAKRQERYREKSRYRHVTVTLPSRDELEERRGDAEEKRGEEKRGDADAEEKPAAAASLFFGDSEFSNRERIFLEQTVYEMQGGSSRLIPEKYLELRNTFPHIDIVSELQKAAQWLRDNPQKRKPITELQNFLFRWLTKV